MVTVDFKVLTSMCIISRSHLLPVHLGTVRWPMADGITYVCRPQGISTCFLACYCVHMRSPSHRSNLTELKHSILCRGAHSLETICLLLALKIEHPRNVHLIRGNHEASDINALFGFRIECIERLGDPNGIWAWQRLNALFNWLPLAATIEEKVLCMHGGETPQTAK